MITNSSRFRDFNEDVVEIVDTKLGSGPFVNREWFVHFGMLGSRSEILLEIFKPFEREI